MASNQNLQYENVIVKKFSRNNNDIIRIHDTLKNTIAPGLSYKHFYDDYIDNNGKPGRVAYKINTTLVKENGVRIGIYFVIFYWQNITGNRKYLARTIVGFAPHTRGRKLYNNMKVQMKYISFKLRHPIEKLTAIITAVNPHIYSSSIEYLKSADPIPTVIEMSKVEALDVTNLVVLSNDFLTDILSGKITQPPWLVKVDFLVNITPQDRIVFINSPTVLKKWYIWKNWRFPDYGILIHFDVNKKNVTAKLKGRFFRRP
jgi:hypothetical protein